MKVRYLLIPFALGLALTLALLWVLGGRTTMASADVKAPSAPVAELHVCPSGCAYSSVQEAVDAASSGDVIKVATGIYTDVHRVRLGGGEYITQVVRLEDTVIIQGGYTTINWSDSDPDANPTTLDAGGQGRVFYIEEGVTVIIKGLRITGGDAYKGDTNAERRGGGGVRATNATVIFRNNHVFGNVASVGGGLYLRFSSVTLDGNTVTSNTAGYGGGLFLNEITVDLSDNTISANIASVDGGGLLLFNSSNATFSGNTIIANTATNGGGGLYLDSSSDTTLINNVIADNIGATGGGLYIKASSPNLLHTAIARNGGGEGVYVISDSNVEMVNTILVSHTVGINVVAGSHASLDATLWYANVTDWSGSVVCAHDQSGDPDFDDPNAGDYHVGNVSAALDRGVNAGVSEDMDGDIRPRGHGYDIGPDEYPDFLSVVKQASPTPARAGEQLVYTIRVTNYSTETFTAAITDILPSHVTFTGVITSWTSQMIEPGSENYWMRTIAVTVEAGYSGRLTNTVEVTTDGDETGAAMLVTGCYAVYLPLVLRNG